MLELWLRDSCLLWSAVSILIKKSALHHDSIIWQLDDTSRMPYAMSKDGFPNIYHHPNIQYDNHSCTVLSFLVVIHGQMLIIPISPIICSTGSGLTEARGYKEVTSDFLCTQRSSANCTIYWPVYWINSMITGNHIIWRECSWLISSFDLLFILNGLGK